MTHKKLIIIVTVILLAFLVACVQDTGSRSSSPSYESTLGPPPAHPGPGSPIAPRILVDGVLYGPVGHIVPDAVITEDEFTGRITSTIPSTETPTENGQMSIDSPVRNGVPVVGTPYVKRDNGLLVLFNDVWARYESLEKLSTRDFWINIIVFDITATGISFVLENTSESIVFTYSQRYTLSVFHSNGLAALDGIVDTRHLEAYGIMRYYGVDDTVHTIPPLSRTELIEVDWYSIFGELPDGRYEFSDIATDDGGYPHFFFYEFTIRG